MDAKARAGGQEEDDPAAGATTAILARRVPGWATDFVATADKLGHDLA